MPFSKAGARHYGEFAGPGAGSLTAEARCKQGDPEQGMFSLGPAPCFIDRAEAVARIIEQIMSKAAISCARLARLRQD